MFKVDCSGFCPMTLVHATVLCLNASNLKCAHCTWVLQTTLTTEIQLWYSGKTLNLPLCLFVVGLVGDRGPVRYFYGSLCLVVFDIAQKFYLNQGVSSQAAHVPQS